MSSLVV